MSVGGDPELQVEVALPAEGVTLFQSALADPAVESKRARKAGAVEDEQTQSRYIVPAVMVNVPSEHGAAAMPEEPVPGHDTLIRQRFVFVLSESE